ncbi:hypothetical protein [Conexibacter arvalis]|uniref:Uncharacterized protein n=1 Tax=Conexibacter arvalis TaxID=912552 RepID=A0A840IIK1_9ACTN|nr:hypothetical protein [Conexibacter arvalis]MBB4664812.1 hypothetical protein [Conexibacter arvalis]
MLDGLADTITASLITYDGRELFRPRDSTFSIYADRVAPTYEAMRIDRQRAIGEIVDAAFAQGGWALYAGHKLIEETCGLDCREPRYLELLDAALGFLHDRECSGMCLNAPERERWIETNGSMASFWDLDGSAIPPPGSEPPVAELEIGESRLIARLEEREDSNLVFAERSTDGGLAAVIDSVWSDDDPRRSRTVWKTAGDLPSVLRAVADGLPGVPYWASDELRPYLPVRRSR